MLRLFFALPLAAALVLSVGVLMSAATPSTVEFTAPRYTALAGEGTEPAEFRAAGIARQCDGVSFEGMLLGPRTLEVEPIYDRCTTKAFSGIPAKFVQSGCVYVLHLDEGLADAKEWTAVVEISCPPEYTLEWHDYETEGMFRGGSALCTAGMPTQKGLRSAELRNLGGSPSEIEIRFELRDIKYRAYGSELFCGSVFGVLQDGASYDGVARIAGRTPFEKPLDLALGS